MTKASLLKGDIWGRGGDKLGKKTTLTALRCWGVCVIHVWPSEVDLRCSSLECFPLRQGSSFSLELINQARLASKPPRSGLRLASAGIPNVRHYIQPFHVGSGGQVSLIYWWIYLPSSELKSFIEALPGPQYRGNPGLTLGQALCIELRPWPIRGYLNLRLVSLKSFILQHLSRSCLCLSSLVPLKLHLQFLYNCSFSKKKKNIFNMYLLCECM